MRTMRKTARCGESPLKPARVRAELGLYGWRLAPDGRSLHRLWEFPDPLLASAYAVFINDLATTLGRAVAIHLFGRRLLVVLPGGRRGGVTEELLRFARFLG